MAGCKKSINYEIFKGNLYFLTFITFISFHTYAEYEMEVVHPHQ